MVIAQTDPAATAYQCARVDGPYEAWLNGAGAAYRLDPLEEHPASLGALLELGPSGLLPASGSSFAFGTGHVARVPELWNAGIRPDGQGDRFVPLIVQGQGPPPPGPSTIAGRIRLNTPLPGATVDAGFGPAAPLAAWTPPPVPADAPIAVVAIIDDGIPFAHRHFRDRANRSRVEFCWRQAGRVASEPARRSVLFGREWARDEIDALIATHGHDEDALYRAAGATFASDEPAFAPLQGLVAHGAAVADLAAGARRPDALTERLRIIAVELPSAAMLDTVGYGKDALVLSAMHYIFARAERMARALGLANLPLFINFSFGFTGGPHDGTDRLESSLRMMVAARKAQGHETALIMPAGNTFEARLAAAIRPADIAPDGPATLPWRLPPDDSTANFLEIWQPRTPTGEPGPPPDAPLVIDPAGTALSLAAVPAHDTALRRWHVMNTAGELIGQVSVDLHRGRQWRIMVILAPTAPRARPGAVMPPSARAGRWLIRVVPGSTVTATSPLACRIQRDTGVLGPTRGGRQSIFDPPGWSPDQPATDSASNDSRSGLVRRFGTLNGLATHDQVVVIGGYVGTTFRRADPGCTRPAPYASAAAVGGGDGRIHGAAASDDSAALMGRVTAGTRSGSSIRLAGTSLAAPQITRAAAMSWLRRAQQVADGPLIGGLRIDGLVMLDAAGPAPPHLTLRLGEALLPYR
jgi:hypothetical protein